MKRPLSRLSLSKLFAILRQLHMQIEPLNVIILQLLEIGIFIWNLNTI